jgi:hypothetical protein
MRGDLLGKLVHVIVEAKKAHDRQSESWKVREADGMAEYKYKGLRSREANGVTISSRPKT